MTTTLATIRTFKSGHFTVTVTAHDEDDLDLSFDDDNTVRNALELGELCAFRVEATVYLFGRDVGCSHLGGCIYPTYRAFMDHVGIKAHNRATGHNCGSYFVDMVREAIGEARATVDAFKRTQLRTK